MKQMGRILGAAVLALFLVGCAGGPNSRSTGQVIDDTAIHTKVKTALLADPVTRGSAIDVSVIRGVVTLDGVVGGEAPLVKAQQIAAGVEGVRAIDNNLVIRNVPPLENEAVGAPGQVEEGRNPPAEDPAGDDPDPIEEDDELQDE